MITTKGKMILTHNQANVSGRVFSIGKPDLFAPEDLDGHAHGELVEDNSDNYDLSVIETKTNKLEVGFEQVSNVYHIVIPDFLKDKVKALEVGDSVSVIATISDDVFIGSQVNKENI